MSRKKQPENANHERWLVSYADFITLLFAFFVVLFASGQADKVKQRKAAKAISSAFAQMALFDPHSTTPAISDAAGAGAPTTPVPLELPMATAGDASHESNATINFELLREHVQQLVEKQIAGGGMKISDLTLRRTPEGLILSLQEGGFFASGSADLRPAAIPTLKSIAAQLPATPIRIEGHTDNRPIGSTLYASNWELSSARASAITRFLLEYSHANPAQLSVAGYAEFHPIASNATEAGRAQNRRVDIVFLEK